MCTGRRWPPGPGTHNNRQTNGGFVHAPAILIVHAQTHRIDERQPMWPTMRRHRHNGIGLLLSFTADPLGNPEERQTSQLRAGKQPYSRSKQRHDQRNARATVWANYPSLDDRGASPIISILQRQPIADLTACKWCHVQRIQRVPGNAAAISTRTFPWLHHRRHHLPHHCAHINSQDNYRVPPIS